MGYRVCWSRHALGRFGRTVAGRPSILCGGLRLLSVFAANPVEGWNPVLGANAVMIVFT